MSDWRDEYLQELRSTFQTQRTLAERAIAQLNDEELLCTLGEDDNSIAVIMKHVGGNLRSRWTEPFRTDGEKADRDRDGEFVVGADDAGSVRSVWERGWSVLEQTLAAMSADDFERTLRIRGEPHSLVRALERSLAHTAQHVGQIVLLAKHWKGAAWQTLSIPRGESARFLAQPPAAN
jgi:Protein of unknown function (DUF1572)